MNLVAIVGGRKAAACITGLVVVVGCFLFKGSIPDQLVDAVKYLVTTYLAGNIAADVVDGIAAHSEGKVEVAKVEAAAVANAPAPAQVKDNSEDIEAIKAKQASLEVALVNQNANVERIMSFLSNPPPRA